MVVLPLTLRMIVDDSPKRLDYHEHGFRTSINTNRGKVKNTTIKIPHKHFTHPTANNPSANEDLKCNAIIQINQ